MGGQFLFQTCADFYRVAIDQDRQNTLTAAYHAHPERFGRRPHPPVMPTQSWINQPELEPQMN